MPAAAILRLVLLAAVVAIAAGWALVRHYSIVFPPMRVPAPPAAAPTYDPEAGEVPVPELFAPDAG